MPVWFIPQFSFCLCQPSCRSLAPAATPFRRSRLRRLGIALLPTADSFVVTELSGTPCEDSAEISAWLAARGARSEVTPDVRAGLRALRRRPGPRLVVGSFYLAGAVRQLVCDHDPRESNEPRS